MPSVYPKKVTERLRVIPRREIPETADAIGLAASLECGTNIRFYLSIGERDGPIYKITFRSNGCGYMLAAADAIIEYLTEKFLTELHGLKSDELIGVIESELGHLPSDRKHCIQTVIDAVRSAFAEYRRSRIEEFAGERALICTCFGVSEEKIENVIKQQSATTVEEIGHLTNAGIGCGSCQMLIRDIIDSQNREP